MTLISSSPGGVRLEKNCILVLLAGFRPFQGNKRCVAKTETTYRPYRYIFGTNGVLTWSYMAEGPLALRRKHTWEPGLEKSPKADYIVNESPTSS
jgi:hypothetical protein